MDSSDKKRRHKDKSYRSRSRSASYDSYEGSSSRFDRKPKKQSKNFSDKPPEQEKQKMSTAEILEYYKQFNPN